MRIPALEITYQQDDMIYVHEGIRQREEEAADVKHLKRRYRKINPQKDEVLAVYKFFSFLYPLLKPLFVSDLVKKKKLTQREQQALREKIHYAELLGVHPDCVIVCNMWEAY